MRIERLHFRDFETGETSAVITRGKHSMPGGTGEEEAPPPPPPPTYSEEELKAAEMESYKKGFLEGTEEGKNQAKNEQAIINQQLLETSENFIKHITPLLVGYRKIAEELRANTPKLALSVAKKVAGDSLKDNAESVINEMVLACAETMVNEPKINITVHSTMVTTLENKLQELSSKIHTASDFTVTGDESLIISDCRIEWKHGAMERNTEELWQRVEKVLEDMSTSTQRETNIEIEQFEQQLPKE